MVDTDTALRSDPGTIPAGIIDFKTRVRPIIEFNQCHVDVRLRGSKRGATLALGRRPGLGPTRGRLKIPQRHNRGGSGGVDSTVGRSQDKGPERAWHIHDQRPGASSRAPNGQHRHTADFIPPVIALGADNINMTRAMVFGEGLSTQNVPITDANVNQGELRGLLSRAWDIELKRDAIPWHRRRPELPVWLVVVGCVRALIVGLAFTENMQGGPPWEPIGAEAQVQIRCAWRFEPQSP